MKARWMLCLFFLNSVSVMAQFTDDFSDDNFDNNPTWSGDVSKFMIDNNKLRLREDATVSTAYLSTENLAIEDATWTFDVDLLFNPSSRNYAKVYLTSNQSNLAQPLNGYYVLIGGADDEVSLYRQTDKKATRIIDGQDGVTNLSVTHLTIKITRNRQKHWSLFIDKGITGTFVLEGEADDATHTLSSYFGLSCHYTSTRAGLFYFDNFFVEGFPYRDTTPPMVIKVEALSPTKAAIIFSEPMDANAVLEVTHYVVDKNVGMPHIVMSTDESTVSIVFLANLINGVSYTISITGLVDLAGNVLDAVEVPFRYFKPAKPLYKDCIISEIHAIPSQQTSLPDVEFVELYNNSDQTFSLENWTFSDETSTVIFPEVVVLPRTYYIITSYSSIDAWQGYANVIDVQSFPSLNNDKDVLTLRDEMGMLIDFVTYTVDGYGDQNKSKGGWSLELIDITNPCGEQNNWTASKNINGGTPGAINSVDAHRPDRQGPILLSVIATDTHTIEIFFNEKMDALASVESLVFTPSLDIDNYTFDFPTMHTLTVTLHSPLQMKQVYTLKLNETYDCNGNLIQTDYNEQSFALPQPAFRGDLVINEILFNPLPGGVDFVEIYNRSNKYIDMQGWKLSNIENSFLADIKNISSEKLVIAPHQFLVFTPDPAILRDHHPHGDIDTFVQAPLPSLPDEKGSVALLDMSGYIIDSLVYDEDFHIVFLRNTEGVSLERINPNPSFPVRDNWISASSVSSFATPGKMNSSSRDGQVLDEGTIKVEPLVFTPYRHTQQFVNIHYSFDQPGLVAHVSVCDRLGRTIKIIANGQTLSRMGTFRWDGERDDKARTRSGYYVIHFKIFNAQGETKILMKRVIVASP